VVLEITKVYVEFTVISITPTARLIDILKKRQLQNAHLNEMLQLPCPVPHFGVVSLF
jgi:hypothetical protein